MKITPDDMGIRQARKEVKWASIGIIVGLIAYTIWRRYG